MGRWQGLVDEKERGIDDENEMFYLEMFDVLTSKIGAPDSVLITFGAQNLGIFFIAICS